MPIAVYPALALTGGRVGDVVSNVQAQVEAQIALHERYRTSFVLSAMDLSAEAEAFGCAVHFSEGEVPTVRGRLVKSAEEARTLAVPRPGDKRTAVHLETVRRLRALPDRPGVLGGCIGPLSLAARLVGVGEALELVIAEPQWMHSVLEKCTRFLADYVRAFHAAGADGVIMAEPVAGLLSPAMMETFSSGYIQSIVTEAPTARFGLVLHNCAARVLHLPALLKTGAKSFHFGAPMEMPAALERVPPDVVLSGNLDPAGVFCQLPAEQVAARAASLLAATARHQNFVLSSGCDLPPDTPLASLDALFAAVNGWT